MANKLRGEVEIAALGEHYVLRLGVNDLINIQDALGMGDDDAAFLERMGRLTGLKAVRTIAWKGLTAAKGEEVTEERAGEIVTDIGIAAFAANIQEAMRWAWPVETTKKGEPNKKGKARSPGRPS